MRFHHVYGPTYFHGPLSLRIRWYGFVTGARWPGSNGSLDREDVHQETSRSGSHCCHVGYARQTSGSVYQANSQLRPSTGYDSSTNCLAGVLSAVRFFIDLQAAFYAPKPGSSRADAFLSPGGFSHSTNRYSGHRAASASSKRELVLVPLQMDAHDACQS